MKLLFPIMSSSSLTDPAMLQNHPHNWCISQMNYWYWLIETFRSLPWWLVTFSYVRSLSVSLWKKSWLKCIILTIAYSLKIVGIVTECISNHNDTNKHNNCLNLICMLNNWLITLLYKTIKELVNWNEEYHLTKVNKLILIFLLRFKWSRQKWICISIYLFTTSFICKNTSTTYSHKQ